MAQQWTQGPVVGEIVPICREMPHPTQNYRNQGEIERIKLNTYIYIFLIFHGSYRYISIQAEMVFLFNEKCFNREKWIK
jgi:hypothetical protein